MSTYLHNLPTYPTYVHTSIHTTTTTTISFVCIYMQNHKNTVRQSSTYPRLQKKRETESEEIRRKMYMVGEFENFLP